MKRGLGLTPKEMSEVFAEWNKGVLDSFLIEITRDVLAFDDDDGKPLVEKILDSAGQKGTGKWTAINALDLGIPVTLIGEVSPMSALSPMDTFSARCSRSAVPEIYHYVVHAMRFASFHIVFGGSS